MKLRGKRKKIHHRLHTLLSMATHHNGSEHLQQYYDLYDEYTQSCDQYLKDYPQEVELLKNKTSIRKVTNQTDSSYTTVKKLALILKWGNIPYENNMYLQKHNEAIQLLIAGKTQRQISNITGTSLNTINIVAKILEFDYVNRTRQRGKEVAKERIDREDMRKEIELFIKTEYNKFRKKYKGKKTFTELREHFNLLEKPSQFTVNEYKKIGVKTLNKLISKNIERQKEEKEKQDDLNQFEFEQLINEAEREDKKLKKRAEREERELEKQKEREELDKLAEQRREEEIERNKEKLETYLLAGINPYSDMWDQCPSEYKNLVYGTQMLEFIWDEDVRKMKELINNTPDMKEYANNNTKEYDEEKASELLHHVKLLNVKNLDGTPVLWRANRKK